MTISFSDKFFPVTDLSTLTEKNLFFKGEKRSGIEIYVRNVEGQSEEEVNFTWAPVSYTEDKLEIQVNFAKPEAITFYDEPNDLELVIHNPYFFIR